MTDPVWLILLALSAARITHLVTTDTIAEPFRYLFRNRPWLDELIHCGWCAGFHISVAHVFLVPHQETWVFYPVAAFAISYAVGALESRQ